MQAILTKRGAYGVTGALFLLISAVFVFFPDLYTSVNATWSRLALFLGMILVVEVATFGLFYHVYNRLHSKKMTYKDVLAAWSAFAIAGLLVVTMTLLIDHIFAATTWQVPGGAVPKTQLYMIAICNVVFFPFLLCAPMAALAEKRISLRAFFARFFQLLCRAYLPLLALTVAFFMLGVGLSFMPSGMGQLASVVCNALHFTLSVEWCIAAIGKTETSIASEEGSENR